MRLPTKATDARQNQSRQARGVVHQDNNPTGLSERQDCPERLCTWPSCCSTLQVFSRRAVSR